MRKALQRGNLPLPRVDIRDCGNELATTIAAALQFQHRFFLREMNGSLFPPRYALRGNEVILDVLCGPGNWCIDVSQRYPDAQVWGVDSHQILVDLARKHRTRGRSQHLQFRVADYTRVLPFANETFDIIHLQNGTSFFPLDQWSSIMAEMVRVLKPGGWLNLVDFEIGAVSQPAVSQMLILFGQILARLNRSTAVYEDWPLTGSTLGLQRMTQHAFVELGYHLYPVDLGGWHNQVGRSYLTWCLARPEMVVSLAKHAGMSTGEELQILLQVARREVQHLGFCGMGMLLSSFGRKPSLRYSEQTRAAIEE
jgi:ubiquinone/menaquinone biosynthesis C-methylase UbiE